MALFDWNNDGKNDWKDDMHEYDFCRPRPNLFEKDKKDNDYKCDDDMFDDNKASDEDVGCGCVVLIAIFLIIVIAYLNL